MLFQRSLFIAVFISLPVLAARPLPLAAPVSRVVLYSDSALVERAVQVKAGAESLEISGMPANFDVASVQIESDSGIEIGELVWRNRVRVDPLNAEEARLEAEVRKLSEQLKALNAEQKTAERELKFLEALLAPDNGNSQTRAADPARALDVIRRGSLRAEQRILEVEAQKYDLEKKLKALEADLENIRPGVDEVRSLFVRLRAKNDGYMRISYFFTGAGWRPAYRAALDSESGRVRLERTAQIAQRSGEDWNRVRLFLSTGAPQRNASGQRPHTWNVNLEESAPAPRQSNMMSMEMAESRPSLKAAPLSASANRAENPLFEAAVIQSEYATEYAISGTVSLPADGRKVAVSLGALNVPVALEAEISPRQEKAAYLVARGELPEGVWPAGAMQLYRNGAYSGQTRWVVDENRLVLPFGRDELIQVSHKSEKNQSGTSGFAEQKAERHSVDTFTVTNRHKRAVNIRVLDASPVSRNDAVKVERRFTPETVQEDWNDRKGVIAWEARLDAGQSKSFSADYRIRWPRKQRIIGLR
ncbi:MAG: mucoidy inhibitor MuiA family protein [Candidatus Accumulibacter sp.]|jgi:uncharacterized protein (TIGR02231 family)|nr:mucoidy inhibitor MuiA family protein [Accumulibacter sp.]